MKQHLAIASSFYDRILGQKQTTNRTSTHLMSNQLLDSMLVTIKRDLQNLFNTQQQLQHSPYQALNDSIINYGLPNLKQLSLSSLEDKAYFKQMVALAIKRHEPRLGDVTVMLNEQDSQYPKGLNLNLRIKARLLVTPEAVPITFISEVEPISQTISVQDICYA